MGRHFAIHHVTGEIHDISYRRSHFPGGWRVLWGDEALGDTHPGQAGSWDVHGRGFDGELFTAEGFVSRRAAAFHLVRRAGIWCTSGTGSGLSGPCPHSDVTATTDLLNGPDAMVRLSDFLDAASEQLDKATAFALAHRLMLRLGEEQHSASEAASADLRAALGARARNLRASWRDEAAATDPAVPTEPA